MEEKKSFFANLEPRSALIVGLVTGILVLCTIGFIVMLIIFLNGNDKVTATQKDGQITANNEVQTPAANAPKSDRPKVELFVMSYCPYGLQMEKAYLPAWELLKNKADFSVKFVSYAMHGLKEIEENNRQYCIEIEQTAKFIPYLKCFTGKDDHKGCLATAGVDQGKMNTCVTNANNKFGTLTKYNDKSTWLSGNYPLYPVNADLNEQYGVQGSPTLVINGVVAQANRTPEAVKQAVCAAFNSSPAECQQSLSTASPVAGFGTGTGADTGAAACE